MAEESGIVGKVLDALVGSGLITTEQLANATETAEQEDIHRSAELLGQISPRRHRLGSHRAELAVPSFGVNEYSCHPMSP